ncbi:hypothetical protein BHK98_02725 [Hornefia porci]|uniref:HTH deoR-type domain-containing protein n=1 Tax=Hornefia porci TaxID=2652292 RepID=A0A1Q9JG25_9FIRM|nr:HTH domain-containing protein [Hornefia porci]OLR55074.1 hypothetical protein BHK98_02725 [Hornefia porci]
MTATERREEIMRIIVVRRRENMTNLARELGVTTRTIRNDILVLTSSYPLETVRGHGGGVYLPDDYQPYKNTLSRKHTETILNLKGRVSEDEWKELEQILREHSPWFPDLDK